MAYIGNDLRSNEDYKIIDDISSGFNGSATSFALQVGGATPVPFPKFEQQLLISVNGVIQEPDPTGSAGFKLLGTNIVFSSAPTNGHAFFGVIYAGADYVNAGGTFPDGSINFPSITFSEDTNTGFTRIASGTVALISDGTKVAQFPTSQGSSGQVLITDGGGNLSFSSTITSPTVSGDLTIPDKIVHTGDTNTAIRFPAADTASVETSGSERLRIDSSGKVGLNETNPSEMLHIKAEDNTDAFGGLIIKANNNSVHMKYGWRGLDANSGGDIRFAVGGTEMMRVLSSGKVGLGRTSADEMLHIKNDDNTDGFGGIKIDANNGSIQCKYGWLGVDGSNSFRIGVAGTERMRVTDAGKVGIGTSNPSQTLDITANNGVGIARFINTASSFSNNNYTVFIDSSSHTSNMTSAGAFAVDVNAGRAMTINGNGDVGIGTSSPTDKLHVVGDVEFTLGTNVFDVMTTGSGSKHPIRLLNADASAGNQVGIQFWTSK